MAALIIAHLRRHIPPANETSRTARYTNVRTRYHTFTLVLLLQSKNTRAQSQLDLCGRVSVQRS